MMTLQEFGQSIKKKYPQYANIEDVELGKKVLEKYPTYQSQIIDSPKVQKQSFLQEAGEDIRQTAGALKETVSKTQEKVQKIAEAEVAGEQGGVRSFGQAFGTIAGGVSRGIGDIVVGAIKTALPSEQEQGLKEGVKQLTSDLIQAAIEKHERMKVEEPEKAAKIEALIHSYTHLSDKSKRDIDAFLGVSQLAIDLATAGTTKKIVDVGTKQAAEAATRAASAATKAVRETGDFVGDIAARVPKELQTKAVRLISAEPDAKVQTILRETPKSKLDEFVRLAEKHAVDQREMSGFEKVGETMSRALKQLERQKSSLGKQKTQIINQARVGLEDFQAPVRRAILEANKIKDNVAERVVAILKKAKNKLQTDKAIDEIQDILYKGNTDLTIPSGSTVDKQLRGIIGKLNEELKAGLPKSYRTLNDKFAQFAENTEILNRSLGQVVEGVSTRGASLVKQFFSPAGTKTKELFAFIKANTGFDLAQDATLAKFVGELFEDPNVRSLLQGIPTSKGGVINRAINVVAERTGVLKKTQEVLRRGTIQKAKDIAR